ncbi:unnamed protein product [Urochloa humidicola]
MKITIQSSKAIEPAYGGAGGAPCCDATAAVPLTVLDKVNFDAHISAVRFFHPPAPPHGALELGLAKALAAHRVWAGRLGVDAGGDRAILLNDAGARLVEATADVALASLMPLEPTAPEPLGLHPGGAAAEELMLAQVTTFACGSFAVGTSAQHLVADGRGARAFLVAWGNATRGAAIDPVFPARGRASVFPPRRPPRVEFDHRGAEFIKPGPGNGGGGGGHEHGGAANKVDDGKLVVRRVCFGRELIAALRSAAPPYSAVACVAAHVWRCVTRARGLDSGEAVTTTTLRVAVDGRQRMRRPPVPEGYTGNVVLWARPAAAAGELVSMPLGHAAALVSRAVSRVDDRYFRSFIDFASSGAAEAEGLAPAADLARTVHSPDVELYSLVGIPLRGLDFGTGPPFLNTLSYLPEGFVILDDSGDGGIDALVCLFRRAMDAFEACCYTPAATAGARL